MANLVQVGSTGDAVDHEAVLHSVVLTAGSDAASVAVRDGTGTDVLMTLKAAANASAVWEASDPGVFLGTGAHVTLTGTGPTVAVEYS
jgi:hypothetical protein